MSFFCENDDDDDKYISNIEYLRHLRDSYPQTGYSLRQWDSLYMEYDCEICPMSMSRIFGNVKKITSRSVNDLTRVCKTGRYTACVNLSLSVDSSVKFEKSSTRQRRLLHVCNFLPIVIGSRLDLSVRFGNVDLHGALRTDPSLSSRLGHVYMFDNFWVLSTFVSTDARQCHRYRERTKSVDCFVRMYVYDRYDKGHMLFARPNDTSLYKRDKHRREIRVVDDLGRFAPENAATTVKSGSKSTKEQNVNSDFGTNVVHDFTRDALVPLFDRRTPEEFFIDCREYMIFGVGDSSEENDDFSENDIGRATRDIDHIDNKRVSSACGLYAMLLRSFARSARDVFDFSEKNENSDRVDDVMSALRSCVVRYATMSQRANLLPFISRKTHIRQDWCESMKRQMKSEIRSNRVFSKNGVLGGGHRTIVNFSANVDNEFEGNAAAADTIRFVAPDVSLDNAKITQPFYCSKTHLDPEYDHEIVKRMRVVNLNAMTCLKMPTGFERFLSYYNIDNIGNAGRVMTRTHGMRESYVPRLDETIALTVSWIRNFFAASSEFSETFSNDRDFTIFVVNEMPVLRSARAVDFGKTLLRKHDDNVSRKRNVFSLWEFALALKFRQPGTVLTVVRLQRNSYYVNVRVANGIPLCLVNAFDVSRRTTVADLWNEARGDDAIAEYRATFAPNDDRYANYCNACRDY